MQVKKEIYKSYRNSKEVVGVLNNEEVIGLNEFVENMNKKEVKEVVEFNIKKR